MSCVAARAAAPAGAAGSRARRGHWPAGLVAGVGEDDMLWLERARGARRALPPSASSRCKGVHNLQNSLAAAAAAAAAGVPPAAVAETLRTFEGVPHRLQVARHRRRRHLHQRLQGDQRRRDAQGAHGVHGRRAPDPRRLRQGRRATTTSRRPPRASSRRSCSSAPRRRSWRRPSPPGAAAGVRRRPPASSAATSAAAVAAAAQAAAAGRRRAAQPGLRQLGPVQGLHRAGRTLPRRWSNEMRGAGTG